MTPFKFEYIWLDVYQPEAYIRSKTKILNFKEFDKKDLAKLPDWSFDGSSTLQAEGSSSDCVLKPVKMYRDPARLNAYLVLCEVMNPDGSKHETNSRAHLAQLAEKFKDEEEVLLFDAEKILIYQALIFHIQI